MKTSTVLALIMIALMLFLSFGVPMIAHRQGEEEGYRAGQIDAQTGKIRWHLTTQPDGEVVWREKE